MGTGAAVSLVDLGGLRLSSLNVETGASQTEVRFSTRNAIRCTTAAFRAGVAELTVLGLGNSRCDRVTFDGGMGSVVLDYTGEWGGDYGTGRDACRRRSHPSHPPGRSA